MPLNGLHRQMRVLHLILMLGETNSQYNEHCLPMVGTRDLSICTYFVPQLTPPSEIALFSGDGSLRGFFRALRAALDAKDYDVVHAHAPQTGVLLVLALLAWWRFGRIRTSLVYTVHDSFYDYKPRNQAMMVFDLVAFGRVMFCSRAAYDSLPRVWKRLMRDRWRVVQNGADIERVDRAIEAGPMARRAGKFTIISVGRLENVKDPMLLLDAFKQSADVDSHLVYVGVGSLESDLATIVNASGMEDRILLTGLIPRDEVFVRCAGADVFVSTSRGEGLPVAVMEAMAARCPVILSDIPPHRELVDGADFIPLIAPGDVAEFAREIHRFREMLVEERLEIGRRCRNHVVARFALPIMHAGIEAVYRELPRFADATTHSP
ncbi:MAG: glycosyltransferase family 4 protein [Chloroflexi bacterium]|nr:glycosyltransferase family 4 protein [Chloroflexota bacterium]